MLTQEENHPVVTLEREHPTLDLNHKFNSGTDVGSVVFSGAFPGFRRVTVHTHQAEVVPPIADLSL